MLGAVRQLGPATWLAAGNDADGLDWTATLRSEPRAISEVVRHAHGGLRFHDVRHSCATWLVSAGVPINDVARIMGHENTSTTLDHYTHSTDDRFMRVLNVFAGSTQGSGG